MRARLDRLLSNLGIAGLGTRSEARSAIREGRVRVDGRVECAPSAYIESETALVTLDGRTLSLAPAPAVMMNKPAGVLTAARDASRKTVADLLPDAWRARGLMPVGRLDMDTTGLLLFTDDGTFAHRILHPKRHLDKRYHAILDAPIADADVESFAAGMRLRDFQALPALLKRDPERADAAYVIIQEGKYHQVKRMFAARGREVCALRRLSIGPITIDPLLEPGACRALTADEEAALRSAVGISL
ncbi:MAG: rRNA pseudouridine synthase [Oscillospiraceae bacterium]|nr:rRNA pseudouridine synthase [Oscillospiraceae bacterium]